MLLFVLVGFVVSRVIWLVLSFALALRVHCVRMCFELVDFVVGVTLFVVGWLLAFTRAYGFGTFRVALMSKCLGVFFGRCFGVGCCLRLGWLVGGLD